MNVHLLRQRAELLQRLREFFVSREFLEVSTPQVDQEIIAELHIDPLEVVSLGYLQASPEMHLKRLLCDGVGPVFEVAKSFRAGERGQHHHPEFTMVEWYRPGDDMLRGIDLLDALTQHLLGTPPANRTSYREAFERQLGVNPHTAPIESLQQLVAQHSTLLSACEATPIADRDELINLLLSGSIESTLGVDAPEILYHYPASQSALAATTIDSQGEQVAERFELYWQGVELANGYHELTDVDELRRRLTMANSQRVVAGRDRLPLPERLLQAMQNPGLPTCAGVALGFDRLVMLAVGAESIQEVIVH